MKRRVSAPDKDGGFAGCSGLVLILLACLLLTSTPQSVYRWWKRDGYTRTEVEVLSPPDSHLRWMRARVLSTGQTLDVRRTSFANSRTRNRLPAWYNPDARLVLGLTVFDERLVSAEAYPELPGGAAVFGGAALTVASGVGGLYLLLSRPAPRRTASKRKRR